MNIIELPNKTGIETVRFGRLEADPATLINFNDGVYGFPGAKKFLLIDSAGDSEFLWLQSAEDPALAFLVMDPTLYYPDFRARVDKENPLLAVSGDDYQLLAIVTVDRNTRRITVNLAAPLAVHSAKREGYQIILTQKDFLLEHDLIHDLRALLTHNAKGKA